MASIFSGRAGRLASIAAGMRLQETQDQVDQRIQSGKKSALTALKGGYGAANKDYDAAIDLYDPFVTAGRKAWDQYGDASGINGQEGHDRAVANFRAGPGYEWQVDQATDAVARKQSAIGALGSGNTMAAITDRASHLADQEYDDYLSRLDNIGKTGFAATGAQAALTQGKGDLDAQYGRDKAGVYGDATRLGVATLSDTGHAIAGTLKDGMMAGQEAAGNRFGAIMGGVNLVAKLLGSAFGAPVAGGGSVGGNMFSKLLG